jgi:anaerobic magnesium-protoporphyrin IX monomethyl ester cyclase
MKVVLIRFPLVAPLGSVNNEPTPPLGLAFLASSLKKAGFDVQGIDATGENLENIQRIPNKRLQYNGLDIDALIEKVDLDSKIIGISSMFTHEWTYIRDCITKLKNKFPSIPIIAGGEHITALSEYSLRDCISLDYAALGEGEETIVEFCKQIEKGKSPNQVDGICFLKDGQFVKNSPRKRIKNVNEIPWPDWEVFNIAPYLDNSISFGASFGRNIPIMATRGCPYQCTFCSNFEMWTKRYYMRDPEDVIDEIKYYIKKYKVTGIQFYDLTAIVKKQWIVEFCNLYLKNKLSIEWSLPSGTRSEALDDEVLQLLQKSNLRYLVYAPESGSENTLVNIKKRISLSAMIHSVKTAVKNNIDVRTNFESVYI